MFLFDYFHIDGIRVDAVGNVNEGAVEFIKKLNIKVFENFDNIMMIAEESTAWPLVTAPIDAGGLGFNFKWNMGWMNDILKYMELDPIYRKFHQNLITFSIAYCFSENFILPLSHDEVVHGKKSLLDKMPGDYWQKFANVRLLFTYLIAHPGKKLTFMGSEFAQFIEWNEWKELDWFLIKEHEKHRKMQVFVNDLNEFYLKNSELYEIDFSYDGFDWIDHRNHDNSVIVFIRKNLKGEFLLIILNFTPELINDYRIGVPEKGIYKEVFNSDKDKYGGANNINKGNIKSEEIPFHGFKQSISITAPPLGASIMRIKEGGKK